ncbi:tetratricopeptide repeat protein [Ruegeria sp. SCP11]|uniref:tetratricopeptide repeat protein n=1 Tax=Ruegeria sp. SCP11 TaxID=3141378 RepID=UPI0033361FCD
MGMHRNRLTAVVLGSILAGSVALPSLGDTSLQDGILALEAGNYSEAHEMLLPFGQAGNVDAQYNLGVMYEEGLGVEQDFSEAFRWMNLAATQGDPDAQVRLGLLFENGLGTEADMVEAAKWYRLSAEQGNLHGQSNLADYYLSQENYAEAAIWLRRAGEQNHPYASYLLGLMYLRGITLEKNVESAQFWIEKAAQLGQPDAIALLQPHPETFSEQATNALNRMRERPEGFVIIEQRPAGKFVQFATSANRNILMNVPYQALSDAENERAAKFFADRDFDASYEALVYGPATSKQVGVQRSYEVILDEDGGAAAKLAEDFFAEVYLFSDGFSFYIEEQ